MDFNLLHYLILIVAGIAAGFVNTIAGGGSIFTLPSLMLLGLPADIANATNRVGVLMQSLAAVRGFNRHKKLDRGAGPWILVPVMIGGLVGSALAAVIPPEVLKPVLLITIMAMTLVIVFRPGSIPEVGEHSLSVREKPLTLLWLFVAGIYGGFVQAGLGFILIAVLAGALRYDLVRANALKMLCTLAITLVALVVFISQGLVYWIPGLIVGLSSIVGVHLSVRFAISAKQSTLKWILLGMAMLVCVAALIK